MLKKLSCILLFMLLVACASSPPAYTGPVVKSSKGYASFAIAITARKSIDDNDLVTAEKELNADINARVRSSTNLRSEDDAGKADLLIKVSLKDLRYLSDGHRFWMGMAAGHAILVADVQIVDQKTGSTIWNSGVNISSNEWDGPAAATSNTQFQAFSEQIAGGMRSSI